MFFNHSFAARRKRDYEYLKSVASKKEMADMANTTGVSGVMAAALAAQAKAQTLALTKAVQNSQSYQQQAVTSNSTGYYVTATGLNANYYPMTAAPGNGVSLVGQYIQGIGQQYGQLYNGSGYAIPAPSGQTISMIMIDANGNSQAVTVDMAYAYIINHISSQHQAAQYFSMSQAQAPKPKLPAMVDGEFSLDEMGVAEEVISEMEGEREEA